MPAIKCGWWPPGFSVRYIDLDENQEAGRRLGAWYDNDRVSEGMTWEWPGIMRSRSSRPAPHVFHSVSSLAAMRRPCFTRDSGGRLSADPLTAFGFVWLEDRHGAAVDGAEFGPEPALKALIGRCAEIGSRSAFGVSVIWWEGGAWHGADVEAVMPPLPPPGIWGMERCDGDSGKSSALWHSSTSAMYSYGSWPLFSGLRPQLNLWLGTVYVRAPRQPLSRQSAPLSCQTPPWMRRTPPRQAAQLTGRCVV